MKSSPSRQKRKKERKMWMAVVKLKCVFYEKVSSHPGSYQDFDTQEFYSYRKKISLLTTFAPALFFKCCLRG